MSTSNTFEPIKTSLVSKKTLLLFDGYMKKQQELFKDLQNPYYRILKSIQHIILTFYHIQFHFDLYTPHGKDSVCHIENEGKIFNSTECKPLRYPLSLNAGCSVGFDKGIREFKLKVNKIDSCGFGITTDVDNATSNRWLYQYEGWTVYLAFGPYGVYPWYAKKIKNGVSAFKNTERGIVNNTFVTLKLDCDNWKIEYFLDSKSIGGCDIKKNCKYYVCFSAYAKNKVAVEIVDSKT